MVEAVAEGANRIAAAPPWRSRPYPDYRDSGVPWLGEIPAGWSVQPLKHLASFSTGWTPPTGREDLYGGQHLWANISDLGPKILAATEKTISDAAIREARLRIVEAGSLLFSFKLSIGTVSIAGVDMYTNEAIAAFSPSSLIDTNYLFWAAPILIPHNAQDNIYGAPLLSRERIANAKILRPNLTEQRAIATFLDRETAKIDALVARKERLIELLQEKRTALITRAVTRGLDPNVSMKDSGVEWLGEIPAHWQVRPLKSISDLQTGLALGKRYEGEAMTTRPYLRVANVQDGYLALDDIAEVEVPVRDVGRFELQTGDVLVTEGGDFDKLGRGHVWQQQLTRCLHQNHIFAVRPRRSALSSHFLPLVMNSGYGRAYFTATSKQSTNLASTNSTRLRNLRFPLPGLDDQVEINRWIERESRRIDTLVTKVRQAMNHLKEFRTALISAAVTGRIDVRGGGAPMSFEPGFSAGTWSRDKL